jgi:hypothetical protein
MAIQWLFCCHVPHNSTANDQNFSHIIAATAALLSTPTLRCRQAAATATVTYLLLVVVIAVIVAVIFAVATTTFSSLLIVVCAPTFAVAASVFAATARIARRPLGAVVYCRNRLVCN